MKAYFCAQDLWDVVNKGYTIPTDISSLTVAQKKEIKENQQKDAQALLALQISFAYEYFPRIMGATSAKATWDKLEEEFKGNKKVCATKFQTLRRKFENLKMKNSGTNEVVNQLRAFGDDIPEKRSLEKF